MSSSHTHNHDYRTFAVALCATRQKSTCSYWGPWQKLILVPLINKHTVHIHNNYVPGKECVCGLCLVGPGSGVHHHLRCPISSQFLWKHGPISQLDILSVFANPKANRLHKGESINFIMCYCGQDILQYLQTRQLRVSLNPFILLLKKPEQSHGVKNNISEQSCSPTPDAC